MRIGYFTNTYPRATDTFIQREVKGLRERGIDVRTFSVRKTGSDHDVGPEVLAEKRSTFYLLPANPIGLLIDNVATLLSHPSRYLGALRLALRTAQPGLRGLLYQMFYFQEAVILARVLRRQGIEHLHNHLGDTSGTVTLLACMMAEISYSITIHGPHLFFDPTHWALREKVKYAGFIACISYYCKSQMMLFSDQADWGRFQIVHCGVDPQHFGYIEVKQPAKKLLYTGRLAAEKGLPVLFESLKLLGQQGYDYELTLVGDGNDRKSLEELARQMGIADRLVFAGFASQDGVRDYLMQSDIFILPSFAEGVPVSLMEAMACGIPVIATYVGGIAELIEPGETGLLVPPSDPAALRDAIARYIDDHSLREKVSRQGREKVMSDFNLDKEVDKLAQLFRIQVGRS
ncbi:MAG: glycosyltransferase [Gammaproteobacteria bacterium]|nr:glycosyltransferase [Gammaproteobacteria bacterium]